VVAQRACVYEWVLAAGDSGHGGLAGRRLRVRARRRDRDAAWASSRPGGVAADRLARRVRELSERLDAHSYERCLAGFVRLVARSHPSRLMRSAMPVAHSAADARVDAGDGSVRSAGCRDGRSPQSTAPRAAP
jgi:hypothetical protein